MATVTCPACSQKYTPLDPNKPFHMACKVEQTLIAQPPPQTDVTLMATPSGTPSAAPSAELPQVDFQSLHLSAAPDDSQDQTLTADAARFVADTPAEGVTPKSSPSHASKSGSGSQGSHGSSKLPGGGSRKPSSRELPEEVVAAMAVPANAVGNYFLIKQVGKGGMGAVYRAWDPKLARLVAIKFLLATEENDILRFQREAQLSAALRHTNIAPIYEYGEHQGKYYLVMEYIDGGSLERMKMTWEEIIATMIPVCQAVDYAHKAGVIHRDIKPQNVMVTSKKLPYVMDFGLAKPVEGGSELSVSGMVVGTPSYMPPEQAQGWTDKIDARSDVYSLGATIYFLMTNVAPFKGPSAMETLMMVIKDDPVAPRRLNPTMPVELEVITLKAMAKEPERRYQTAGELAEDLRRFSAGESIMARPPSLHFMMIRAVKRNKAVFVSIVLALLVCVVLAWTVTRPKVGKDPVVAWVAEFDKSSEPLQWSKFKGKAATNAAQAATLQKMLGSEHLPKAWDKVSKWYGDQADTAALQLDPWKKAKGAARFENSAAARGMTEWATLLARTLDGLPTDTKPIVARLDLISRDASLIADYLGVFRLTLNPAPFGKLQSLKSGKVTIVQNGAVVDAEHGAPVEPDLTSPVVIADLEIDTYEAELVHPKLGTRKFTIKKEDLQPAGDYLLGGDMSKENGLRLTVR